MTTEKTTAKSERSPAQNGVVYAVTHLVETLAKNVEDLRGRLTRTVVNAKSLEDVVHAESKYLQKHLTASIDAGRKVIEICAETRRNATEPIT